MMLTTAIVFALLTTPPAPALGQEPTPATVNDSLVWDYDPADLTSGAVVRFEVCLAPNPCVSVAPADVKGRTAAEWRWKLPQLTPGTTYTATVKACSADLCSEPSNSYALKFVPVVVPPRNVRLGQGGN